MKKVKICGLSRPEDIAAVNLALPDCCGFVINFPKSPRNVSPDEVKRLRAGLSGGIEPVGVFVDEAPELIAELLSSGVIAAAQLHGSEDAAYISRLRALTAKPLWQSFQIRTASDVARAAESTADFVLLDAGQGSGRAFDWALLRGFPRPFALAGGLSAENLPEAMRTGAELFDVSGGVETNGVKDAEKIKVFVDTVRSR